MTNDNTALLGVGALGLAYLATRPTGGSGDQGGVLASIEDALMGLRDEVESAVQDQQQDETTGTTSDGATGVQSSTSESFRSTGTYSGGTTFTVTDESGDESDLFVGGLSGGTIEEEETEAVQSALNVYDYDEETGLLEGD